MDKEEYLNKVSQVLSRSKQRKEVLALIESLSEDEIETLLGRITTPEPLIREGVRYCLTMDTVKRHDREVQNYINNLVHVIRKIQRRRTKMHRVKNVSDAADD